MKHLAFLLPLTLLAACQAPGLVPQAPADGTRQLLVRFQPGASGPERARLRAAAGVTDAATIMPDGERWTVAGPAGEALAAVAGDPAVKAAQLNHHRALAPVIGPEADPTRSFRVLETLGLNDPDVDKQWHLARAKFPAVWRFTQGEGVTVAVIDSGVDPDHPDLKANLLPFVDEVDRMGNKDVLDGVNYKNKDGHGHGTHVTGILGAVANNGTGISGAAPRVKILPIKVTTSTGDADDATISKGIVDAVDMGARVINLSIGGPEPSPVLLEALNYAFNKNVAVVIAAGNDGQSVNYPAAYNGVISVGAITPLDKRASYSSHGNELVMVAPGGGTPGRNEGEQIYSTTPTYPVWITKYERKSNSYSYLAGTSMAAPQVTAMAALLLTKEPNLSPAQMRTRLAATADGMAAGGYDEFYGFGALNAERCYTATLDDGRNP